MSCSCSDDSPKNKYSKLISNLFLWARVTHFLTIAMIFPFTREFGGGAPLNALNLLSFLSDQIDVCIIATNWCQGGEITSDQYSLHPLVGTLLEGQHGELGHTNLPTTTTLSNSCTALKVSTMRGTTTMSTNSTTTYTTMISSNWDTVSQVLTRRTLNLRNIRITLTIRYSFIFCCSVYTWYCTTSQHEVCTWIGTTTIIFNILVNITINTQYKQRPIPKTLIIYLVGGIFH
jgi:hypothetical protein